MPGVSRDTAKRVPVYDDDADVFLLSGAEQLVPVSSPSQGAVRYRPRTEGLFARVAHLKSGQTDYWEVRSRSGLISLYGDARPLGADLPVVHHPDESGRIFSWHLTQTRDPFGNRIEYLTSGARCEDGPHRWDQIYLKTIRYADYGPRTPRSSLSRSTSSTTRGRIRFRVTDRVRDPNHSALCPDRNPYPRRRCPIDARISSDLSG